MIEPADRPGLERLLRYCARPAFASERLSWDGSDQRHRHHYTGVFAPHVALRARITACAGQPVSEAVPRVASRTDPALLAPSRRRASIRAILAHLGEPTAPPALAPRARDPPELHAGFTCAFDQSPWWDSTAAASEPSFHFDQTLN